MTVPQEPAFVPSSIPYVSPSESALYGGFWFGTEHLWTVIPMNETWSSLPHNPEGYTQKIFWCSDRYSLKEELEPDLVVSGQRLDTSAPPVVVSKATNIYASDIGCAILVGVDFPTLGCWKIIGNYNGAELSF